MIEVLDPGVFTTVQDAGRPNLSHLGISPGGAADSTSYRIANALVGNSGSEAALELTLAGGRFRFRVEVDFAVTGADFHPTLDGKPVAAWETAHARAGQILTLGTAAAGARAYFAVNGGFDVPKVMGSRSTLAPASLGGFEGRPLRAGDKIPVGVGDPETVRCVSRFRPTFETRVELLALPLTDLAKCTPDARAQLTKSWHVVEEQSNRSGLRLSGPPILMPEYSEPVTEGVLWGTVQLPSSGQPIVLMNDQQTTGGYPKIAQVIRRDWPRLGQLRPGNEVRFRFITIPEAMTLLRETETQLRAAVAPL